MNTLSADQHINPQALASCRKDFPILQTEVRGKPLVYLDNGATAQKPQVVLDTLLDYYKTENSNVHRGVHYLSDKATRDFEAARETARAFLNARQAHEIILTTGTTGSVNLVANAYGQQFIREGDEIILSTMEHHSNIVPWQLLCERTGAALRVIPVNEAGELDLDAFRKMLNERTKMVAIVHVSNALGTINPVETIIEAAHQYDVPVLLDGAQATPHMAIDVQALDVDFYTMSAHKAFGPTGVGLLYGKEKWLDAMPPFLGGGEMIDRVSFEKTTYNQLPWKFEPGTPNIAGVIGMARAMDYITGIGYDRIGAHEASLLRFATRSLEQIEGMRIIGQAKEKASVISFLIDGVHPSDLGTLLDMEGIAVRTGHHCTQPLMDHYQIPGTVRASFAFYNTLEEIDRLTEAIRKAMTIL